MAYRHWCGECGFKTAWSPRTQSEQRQIDHYLTHHPGIPPGGQVETKPRHLGGSVACLSLIGLAVVVLLVAAACRH